MLWAAHIALLPCCLLCYFQSRCISLAVFANPARLHSSLQGIICLWQRCLCPTALPALHSMFPRHGPLTAPPVSYSAACVLCLGNMPCRALRGQAVLAKTGLLLTALPVSYGWPGLGQPCCLYCKNTVWPGTMSSTSLQAVCCLHITHPALLQGRCLGGERPAVPGGLTDEPV